MTENQQSKQHSEESKESQPRHVAELLRSRPWLVWLGALVFLVSITAISVDSLFLPETDNATQLELEPRVENPAEIFPNPSTLLQLWLLGSVAFCFVAGSLVIAKSNRSCQLPKLRQSANSSAQAVLTRRQLRRRRLKAQPSVFTPPEPPVKLSVPVETELIVTAPLPSENQVLANTEISPPEATALPLQENPATDPGEDSLAEMLDIRKRLSLSAILRDCDRFRSYGEKFSRHGRDADTATELNSSGGVGLMEKPPTE